VTEDANPAEQFKEWAILEVYGHRRLAGIVSDVTLFGAPMIRIDIPDVAGEGWTTQFYSPQAMYSLTPTTEEIARAVARSNQPEPVHRFELLGRGAGGPDREDDDQPW